MAIANNMHNFYGKNNFRAKGDEIMTIANAVDRIQNLCEVVKQASAAYELVDEDFKNELRKDGVDTNSVSIMFFKDRATVGFGVGYIRTTNVDLKYDTECSVSFDFDKNNIDVSYEYGDAIWENLPMSKDDVSGIEDLVVFRQSNQHPLDYRKLILISFRISA